MIHPIVRAMMRLIAQADADKKAIAHLDFEPEDSPLPDE